MEEHEPFQRRQNEIPVFRGFALFHVQLVSSGPIASSFRWKSRVETHIPTPNMFIVSVKDVEKSTRFYRDLFDMEPIMTTPRYVPFEIAPGVIFAIWSGSGAEVMPTTPRSSEVGLLLPGGGAEIDDLFDTWVERGATVVEKPHDDVFGRTFVVADPDGNLLRGAPVDR